MACSAAGVRRWVGEPLAFPLASREPRALSTTARSSRSLIEASGLAHLVGPRRRPPDRAR